MKHFTIPMLTEAEVAEQVAKIGTSQAYGKGSKQFTFTEGHKREYAVNKFFNPHYTFEKDRKPFYQFSDIPEKNASVKSPNCTIFVNGKVINDSTSVEEATEHFINNCVSTTYYIVVKPTKWGEGCGENEYLVIELNTKEMRKLLLEYGSIDRDSRSHSKNCLRLKRTDAIITKWYRMNRL